MCMGVCLINNLILLVRASDLERGYDRSSDNDLDELITSLSVEKEEKR